MATVSVYCLPLALRVEPPYLRSNVRPISFDVELEEGSYGVCSEQVESQFEAGRNMSLLPVSRSTVRHSVNFGHSNLSVSKR